MNGAHSPPHRRDSTGLGRGRGGRSLRVAQVIRICSQVCQPQERRQSHLPTAPSHPGQGKVNYSLHLVKHGDRFRAAFRPSGYSVTLRRRPRCSQQTLGPRSREPGPPGPRNHALPAPRPRGASSGRRHWARRRAASGACGSAARPGGRGTGIGAGPASGPARHLSPPEPDPPRAPLPRPGSPALAAPPPRPGGAAMALGWGCTHLHGRHSLGHFPAQRRVLVADLLRGQSLGPAPAPAVQPQALNAQLLRLWPC